MNLGGGIGILFIEPVAALYSCMVIPCKFRHFTRQIHYVSKIVETKFTVGCYMM